PLCRVLFVENKLEEIIQAIIQLLNVACSTLDFSFFNFLDKGEALSNICKDLHFLVRDIDGINVGLMTAEDQQQEQKEARKRSHISIIIFKRRNKVMSKDFFEMGGLGTLIWTLTIQGI
ncbi:hypothetical protein ACJX0J_025577, partial [Zea mays]